MTNAIHVDITLDRLHAMNAEAPNVATRKARSRRRYADARARAP
jgi:hypothetical protein